MIFNFQYKGEANEKIFKLVVLVLGFVFTTALGSQAFAQAVPCCALSDEMVVNTVLLLLAISAKMVGGEKPPKVHIVINNFKNFRRELAKTSRIAIIRNTSMSSFFGSIANSGNPNSSYANNFL